ncbi:hypothetical protein [Neolewinella persica]|uniref:hypothetical protein n=1 Tax=Neolewinella persica TaxID=70998 RepID=UPI0003A5B851|nr:hypothetical protein [Neolewinella persica]
MTFPRLLSSLILLFLPVLASATSIFDRLYSGTEAPLEFRLELPVDSLLAKVNGDQLAKVFFTDVNGEANTWDLEVAIRGKFRRQRCEFPPLKLNFSKKDLRAAGLETFDKYKLVSSCSADPLAGNLVLKEFLAYRAYNLLTDVSFRVQRLTITFVDVNGNHPDRVEHGFIIEETDELAARLNLEEMESAIGQPAHLYNPTAEATQALIQYMVSNGDWSTVLARNIKVYKAADDQLIPVGYDFDFSGWVGAPYASPSSDIGQQSIYQRVYQGYVQPDKVMREVADHFREQRRPVMDLIDNFTDLPTEDRTVLRRFVARFFRELNQMNINNSILLYDQLRGATAGVIPPGAEADAFQSMGK